MLTAIIFILVLSILVFVHELGHFWTARSLGVKAEEFGFGFPPRAIGIYKDSSKKWRVIKGSQDAEELAEEDRPQGTIYSLNWLPIGGFVRIKGENGSEKNDPDSFASASLWRRALILVAGVVMNIILAAVLLSAGYMIGIPQAPEDAGYGAQIKEAKVLVLETLPSSPAQTAGIKAGDVVLAVDGKKVDSSQALITAVAARNGQSTDFLIERDGKQLDIQATPKLEKGSNQPSIGISIYSSAIVRYPFFIAIWEGIKSTFITFWKIIVAFGVLIAGIFKGASVSEAVAGPVGIASLTGQVAHLGFNYLLQFMAFLSLNLALINIIPFPALDGGRLLFLFIEKVKGKPVRQSVESWIHTVGFWLLILLIIFITYRDIVRLF